MSVKTVIELNEKELKEILCKHYDLQLQGATMTISQIPAEYNQGTSTTLVLQAPRQTQSEKNREDAGKRQSYYEK